MVYLPFIHHCDPLNDSLIRSYFLGGMAFSIPNDLLGGMEGSNQGFWKMGAGRAGGEFGILTFVAVKHRYFIFWFYSCCIDFCILDLLFCFQVMLCYGKSSLNPHLRWMMLYLFQIGSQIFNK